MSEHIPHGIPEDAWPDGMEWHAWDADGVGWWYGLNADPDVPKWYWHAVRSELPMPAGWNWRVRVERPKEAATRDAADEAKETDLWRCTVCGQVSTVGRCCGEETREPFHPLR